MHDIKQLYDDVMLDHIRNARNYRKIADADQLVERFNPLCGDELILYVNLDEDVICDIAFQCSCCGISMASASMMTEQIRGKSRIEAQTMANAFIEGLRESAASPGELRAVSHAVRDFPSRIQCATLAWEALQAALEPMVAGKTGDANF
ncbi:MAG: Fe-S cluster assembly sulfur transfer protein SufU [Burkholderiales bacterium]